METSIKIPLSKKKLNRMIIISVIFIILGIFMLVKGGDMMGDNTFKRYFVLVAGALVIPLCCWTLYFSVKKIKNLETGLCITDLGIYDNSSGIDIGLIKWEDITGLKEWDNRNGTKSIAVVVQNPKDYISKANGFWMKNLMRANYKMAGTPLLFLQYR